MHSCISTQFTTQYICVSWPGGTCENSDLVQDLEAGDAQQSEKSLLLADRRTSSLDEEHNVSMSRAHSRTPPAKPKASLQVSSETTPSDQQGADQGKRLKGLGLAGIATVFQAVMSVCAKILGSEELHSSHVVHQACCKSWHIYAV